MHTPFELRKSSREQPTEILVYTHIHLLKWTPQTLLWKWGLCLVLVVPSAGSLPISFTVYSSILDKKQKKHLDFISPSSWNPIFYLPFRTNFSKGWLTLTVPIPLLPFFLESILLSGPLLLIQNCSRQGNPHSHTVKVNGQF